MRQKMSHCIYQTRILLENSRGNASDLDINFALRIADLIDSSRICRQLQADSETATVLAHCSRDIASVCKWQPQICQARELGWKRSREKEEPYVWFDVNPLKPNDHHSGRTAPLTSKRCILNIYSTNMGTEYFKHGIYSPIFSLQNAVRFIILTYLVPVLFTFYIFIQQI